MGFKVYSPENKAGILKDPPISEPKAAFTSKFDTNAASPPLEPPAVLV